jgi:hypothetical protein
VNRCRQSFGRRRLRDEVRSCPEEEGEVPRYFFHVHDGCDRPDKEGTDLVDLDSAREEAVRFAAGLLSDHRDEFWQGHEWRIEVANASGRTLLKLQFMASVVAANGEDADADHLVAAGRL